MESTLVRIGGHVWVSSGIVGHATIRGQCHPRFVAHRIVTTILRVERFDQFLFDILPVDNVEVHVRRAVAQSDARGLMQAAELSPHDQSVPRAD